MIKGSLLNNIYHFHFGSYWEYYANWNALCTSWNWFKLFYGLLVKASLNSWSSSCRALHTTWISNLWWPHVLFLQTYFSKFQSWNSTIQYSASGSDHPLPKVATQWSNSPSLSFSDHPSELVALTLPCCKTLLMWYLLMTTSIKEGSEPDITCN